MPTQKYNSKGFSAEEDNDFVKYVFPRKQELVVVKNSSRLEGTLAKLNLADNNGFNRFYSALQNSSQAGLETFIALPSGYWNPDNSSSSNKLRDLFNKFKIYPIEDYETIKKRVIIEGDNVLLLTKNRNQSDFNNVLKQWFGFLSADAYASVNGFNARDKIKNSIHAILGETGYSIKGVRSANYQIDTLQFLDDLRHRTQNSVSRKGFPKIIAGYN